MKRRLLLTVLIPAALTGLMLMAGCGGSREDVPMAYQIYDTTDTYIEDLKEDDGTEAAFFSRDLCVGGQENTVSEDLPDENVETAAVFCIDDKKVSYAKNIYEKRYPASTTKILTALLALKYGNPDTILTVSDTAIDSLHPASSVCGLKKGDKIRMEDALYGLMLPSGNDAANVIAEGISGSIEAFADLMNREAYALGATDSHFVNPSGLHDDNHYTTAYDLYLLFNAALQNEDFVKLISTKSYKVSYENQAGENIVTTWNNTNWYLTGTQPEPDGITVIGGKTGTTDEAGNCLILYSRSQNEEPVISVVLKGKSKKSLYSFMSSMLAEYTKE